MVALFVGGAVLRSKACGVALRDQANGRALPDLEGFRVAVEVLVAGRKKQPWLAQPRNGPKGGSVFRILFFGDTLLWSGETGLGKPYTELIEETLNRPPSSEGSIEVMNAGVPGYTTYQESGLLRQCGLEMQPDLVVSGLAFDNVHHKYIHRLTAKALLPREQEARLPARLQKKVS